MRNLLEGKNIRLTALREFDSTVLEQWFTDAAFMRNYDVVPAVPLNQKGVEELFKYYEESQERLILAARLKNDNTLIGVAGFDEIVWTNGTAFLFIGIGNDEFRGKGYGREAINLLIDYGFNELNFHKIQLNVIAYNHRAVGLYEAAGFIKEGTYREYIHRDGSRYDMYLYGLLKDEWKGNVK